VANLSGIFVVVDVTGPVGDNVIAVQREHDPRLAALWHPHVTLIGSSGAGPIVTGTPVDELRTMLGSVADTTAPLMLKFGRPYRFPDRDIVVLPLDPHGPLRTLHERLRSSGIRTHAARYPFTPHCTLTMYPPLTREREQRLLRMRFDEPLRIDRLRVLLTREPQPAKLLLELPLGASLPESAASGS
jgi:2'-5' RNA ligase